MQFNQIRYFLAACDTLNFTRAAEICEVSQPALTIAVKRLEEELGGALFIRDARQLRLTELGRIMRVHLSKIDETRSNAVEAARRIVDDEIKTIDFGVMCTLSPYALMPALRDWCKSVEGVDLVLHDLWRVGVADMLSTGAINCAVVSEECPVPERFSSRRLYRERFVLAMADDNPLAKMTDLELADLKGISYVNRARCEFQTEIFNALAEHDISIDIVFSSEVEDWVCRAIRCGMGVSFMGEDTALNAGLTYRTINNLPIERTINIITAGSSDTMPAVQSLSDFLIDYRWGGANGV
ncbi:MAG: LysR family transcriptional regulator [Pseudomonadota bacterium]